MEGKPMPQVSVVFYQEHEEVELREWLADRTEDKRLQCIDRLMSLQEYGHELDFPDSEHLEDKIYQLRARAKKVRLRMPYFFHERQAAVVTHGFVKKTQKTPPVEIQRAKGKRKRYQEDPRSNSFHWEPDSD
jgi:phage-related protein